MMRSLIPQKWRAKGKGEEVEANYFPGMRSTALRTLLGLSKKVPEARDDPERQVKK